MSSDGRTPLERAINRERQAQGYPTTTESDEDADTAPTAMELLADRPGITAAKTHIGGEQVDLAAPATTIVFEDSGGLLSGEHGQPRPRKFWHARQLGQTPQMQLIKHAIAQQLTGGRVKVISEDELQGPMADFASLIEDVYAGPHFQEKSFDDLVVDTINSLVDAAWSYWEVLPSEDGEFPVAGFKPLPPLQIQHNVSEETGQLRDDPAFYQVPYKRQGNNITIGSDPTPLDREQVVAMRGPLTSEDDTLYGESLATKVREWLELITDVDVHQKRHYADSQLPAGFLHFTGSLSDDDLTAIEQDIVEVSGDPHELVTTSTEGDANWIPVGEGVVDLDAIQEQQWYFKLVLAAAGLNPNEVGLMVGENAGFAKETPAQVKQTFKKIAKPYKKAIMGPQTTQVLPRMVDALGADPNTHLEIDLERFDPIQEQVERDEMLELWAQGQLSLAEGRGKLGRETEPVPVELGGVEVDLTTTPKYVVDKLIQAEQPDLGSAMGGGGGGGDSANAAEHAPLGDDPVLPIREAGEKLGVPNPAAAQSRLQDNVKQLENSIELMSSFLVSTAFDRVAPLIQLEFEREDRPNYVYWYGPGERDAAQFERFWFRFLQSSSKGGFFNRNIRDELPYARVR